MSEKKKITKRRQRSRPGEMPQILKTAHGSAYMNYKGSRYFLGTYGSEEAEKERRRIVAEVEAGKSISPKRSEPITVSMLVVRFLDWVQKKYRKNDRSTGSYERFKLAVQPLLSLYGRKQVDDSCESFSAGYEQVEQDRASVVQSHFDAELPKRRKGQPLVSLAVMIELIGHTTSQTGLKVYAMEDHNFYPTKRKISDKGMNELNLVKDETLGKWNYTLSQDN